MHEKTVDECNAYSMGWNDQQAGAKPNPPQEPKLKEMYDLGYNDANDQAETDRQIAYLDQRTQAYSDWRNRR